MSVPVIDAAVRPNLFIVGAMKAGTSSLHAALKIHPRVFMSEPKEPGFFAVPSLRPASVFGDSPSEDECLQTYLRLFQAGRGALYVGESSTHYTKCLCPGHSAAAIHNFNPNARIIYIVRDPIERTISHYWWNCQHEDETRDPLTAIIHDEQYRAYSYYAWQIRPFLDRFSRDKVLLLTFEEFTKNTGPQLARVFDWLNIDVQPALSASNICENATPPQIIQSRSAVMSALRRSRAYRAMRRVIPKRICAFAREMNERAVDRSTADLSDVVAYLRPLQIAETEELSDLFGRTFSQWQTLYPDSLSVTN